MGSLAWLDVDPQRTTDAISHSEGNAVVLRLGSNIRHEVRIFARLRPQRLAIIPVRLGDRGEGAAWIPIVHDSIPPKLQAFILGGVRCCDAVVEGATTGLLVWHMHRGEQAARGIRHVL